jgi:putative N6-adenine-specific DNA methylase
MKLIAKTMAGLEGVLAAELLQIGAVEIRQAARAVHFEGNEEVLYRSNFELRTALRILMPIAEFVARDEATLYKHVFDIDWQQYMDVSNTFAVDAVTWSETMRHSKYVALKTKDAIADHFRKVLGRRPDVRVDDPDLLVHVHLNGVQATIALDSSGVSLHRRGYRLQGGVAPLNEILAAGMILLTGWQADQPLIDPMCGSGTLLLEAALLAGRIPPQWQRKKFAFQQWKNYQPEVWEQVRRNALAQSSISWPSIMGFDRDFRALRIAAENIAQAHLSERITLEKMSFEALQPPAGPGIVVMNPPYDERIPLEQTEQFYKRIGDTLKQRYAGYEAWVLSANMEALKQIGLHPSRKITLFNGPLECKFLKFSLYEGSKKVKYSKPLT